MDQTGDRQPGGAAAAAPALARAGGTVGEAALGAGSVQDMETAIAACERQQL